MLVMSLPTSSFIVWSSFEEVVRSRGAVDSFMGSWPYLDSARLSGRAASRRRCVSPNGFGPQAQATSRQAPSRCTEQPDLANGQQRQDRCAGTSRESCRPSPGGAEHPMKTTEERGARS